MSCAASFQAAQRELERQRKEEWERRRRGELQIKKEQEHDDIIKLKAKKRSLEMELEAVVRLCESLFHRTHCGAATVLPAAAAHINLLASFLCAALPQGDKHRQISDRLRDLQNKKKLQKTELDLTNQRIERRQQDINNLQKELEVCVCPVCMELLCFMCQIIICSRVLKTFCSLLKSLIRSSRGSCPI